MTKIDHFKLEHVIQVDVHVELPEDGSASAEPLSSSPDPGSHFRTIQSPSLLVQDSLFQDDLTPSHGSRRTLQTSDYADISSHRLGQRQVYGPELVSHLEPQMHMWRSVRSREAAAQWAAQVDGYDYYHASDPEQGDDDNEEAR
ncbi:hypothetical protein BGZ73_001952 [Actinomortierella ambigua]|nr:hypothetical protein BGZ73_001952 [Actinomortierella ambigua]